MIKKYKEFIKSTLIVLVLEAFLYFIIKNFINSYNTVSSLGFEFPLIKEFVYIYNSWYPFIFLASFIIYIKNKELYKKFILTMIIGILLSDLTFLIYPTIIVRPEIEIKGFTDLILYLTYYFDTPAVNCVPSVHCLFCFISIYYVTLNKKIKTKIKVPIITYLILIILSTLFIKQHLLIDVVVASIYTIISILLTNILYKKVKRALNLLF